MKILSLQVGSSKPIEAGGKTWSTGIYKHTVDGPIYLGIEGLFGDVQANLRFHGGEARALYIFSQKAYAYWIPHTKNQSILRPGAFGETVIQATMPHFPCLLLAAKFENPDAIALLRKSKRPGVPEKLISRISIYTSNHPVSKR